ncbi:MAG TPA: hypothetical protein VMU68_11355 [Acidimicrobiales bacterium]|jgi:hypothetical protein|nr:hypothetical protein [Acidimicrobiales bacterium]
MLTDTQIESMLEGHFRDLTGSGAVIEPDSIIAKYQRHQRRVRRSLSTTAGVVVALGTALSLTLGGVGSHRQSSSGEAVHLGSSGEVVHLASYTFRLPRHYQLVNDVTSQCLAVALFQVPFTDTTAPLSNSSPYTNEVIANDVAQQGSCVALAITTGYSMNTGGADPFEVAGSQRVSIGSYTAWVYTSVGWNGVPAVDLGVEVPEGAGQYRDVVIGTSGLSVNTVESIAASGLSSSS